MDLEGVTVILSTTLAIAIRAVTIGRLKMKEKRSHQNRALRAKRERELVAYLNSGNSSYRTLITFEQLTVLSTKITDLRQELGYIKEYTPLVYLDLDIDDDDDSDDCIKA